MSGALTKYTATRQKLQFLGFNEQPNNFFLHVFDVFSATIEIMEFEPVYQMSQYIIISFRVVRAVETSSANNEMNRNYGLKLVLSETDEFGLLFLKK